MTDKRKEELIGIFILAFCKYGIDGTTTKKLAEEANLSEAGLYVHFKNKEDILVKCVEEHFNKVKTNTESIIREYGDEPEKFIQMMFAYVKSMLMENRFIFQVLSHPQCSELIKSSRESLIGSVKSQTELLGRMGIESETGLALILLFNSALNNYILTQDEDSFRIQTNLIIKLLTQHTTRK